MTALLKLLADSALAAAELAALALATPALAAPPTEVSESPVALHRLTTASTTRLLGALDDARVLHGVRTDGRVPHDMAALTFAADRAALRIDAVAIHCGEARGHAVLTLDEAIADATMSAAGHDTVVADVAVQLRSQHAPGDAAAARALLMSQGEARFVLIVPHIDARTATLVLRPARGPSERFELGAVASGSELVVPISSGLRFDALAAGAIELTLTGPRGTVWTTLIGEVVDGSASVQTRMGD
jgi:hypothetical protein